MLFEHKNNLYFDLKRYEGAYLAYFCSVNQDYLS